jgi:hypothetical protein
VTTVKLENVHAASPVGPARHGTLGWPGFGGYSPAGVFAKIVDRARKKARRRQTHGVNAAARALVVNLTHTKIAEDLIRADAHMAGAKAVLDAPGGRRHRTPGSGSCAGSEPSEEIAPAPVSSRCSRRPSLNSRSYRSSSMPGVTFATGAAASAASTWSDHRSIARDRCRPETT